MKRVFAHKGQAIVRDVPEPELRPGEVLVQTAYSAISAGTESWIIRSSASPDWTTHEYPDPNSPGPQYRDPAVPYRGPQPRAQASDWSSIGYSNAGRVIAVSPEVVDIKVGDRVACSGSQAAWHSERVAVPRNLVAPVPDGVSLDQAAFVTLGAISMEALRRTETHFGEVVVAYGLGLLGLLATQMAAHAGIRVIGLDTNPERLEQALRMGASLAVDPSKEDAVAAVHGFTRGFGADAVILGVVTESSEPLNSSFDMTRYRGRVVGLGLFGMDITRSQMFANDVTFVGSRAYGPGRYDPVYEEGGVDMPIGFVRWTENRNATEFLRLVGIGAVKLDELAPHRVPIDEAPRAYEMLTQPGRPPTVILDYGTE